jgi:virulence-associated protein VagC
MKVAEIVRIDGRQLVKLPEGFQLEGDTVSIRRQGESLVLHEIWSRWSRPNAKAKMTAHATKLTAQRLREGHESFCQGAHIQVPPDVCIERSSIAGELAVRWLPAAAQSFHAAPADSNAGTPWCELLHD